MWVADYVLGSYGSGAIMAVPGHDARDYEFAQAFGLPVRRVVAPAADADADASSSSEGGDDGLPYTSLGVAVNSSSGAGLALDGLDTQAAKAATIDWLEAQGLGSRQARLCGGGVGRGCAGACPASASVAASHGCCCCQSPT